MRRTLPTFALVLAFALRPLAFQQKITINDPAEFQAYTAATNTSDPAQQAAAFEVFLQQYPNSTVKVNALKQMMAAYQLAGNTDKVERIGLRILELIPNDVRVLAIVTVLESSRAHTLRDPEEARQLEQQVRSFAEKGLEALKVWQRPEGMNDGQFQKLHDQMQTIFSNAVHPSGEAGGQLALSNHPASPNPPSGSGAGNQARAAGDFRAYIEARSESQSIEKTQQSALKIRNALLFQSTFVALRSQNTYNAFAWPGFYEFRNPGDKVIVVTDFRVLWPPVESQGKQLSLKTRSKPDSVIVFDDQNAIIKTQSGGADPAPQKFPIDIPPHATRYLKIPFTFDLASSDKTLALQDENEAYKWLSEAIGSPRNAQGQCAATGNIPIEVSTSDGQVLKYVPFTALLVPGCKMLMPSLPK
jgi:hypothetical protein